MNRRYILATTLIVVVTLVSSQLVFLNTVKSDPSIHTGDAWIGELWVSELNVSAEAESIDYIGIGHAQADDDWVLWTEKVGNIKINWSTDIENNHPEYWVTYGFFVYNIDDNNTEVGNATLMKTYVEDRSYDESGTLTVAVDFSGSSESQYTLFCLVTTMVILNNTGELINLTSVGQDRSIVGADFESPQGQPTFESFVDEANDDWPSMWSWLNGWNSSSRFDDEDDMFNTQTYFQVGSSPSPSVGGHEWDMGHLDIYHYPFPRIEGVMDYDNLDVTFSFDSEGKMDIHSYITYEDHIAQGPTFPWFISRFRVTCFSPEFLTEPSTFGSPIDDGQMDCGFTCTEEHVGFNNKINLMIFIWVYKIGAWADTKLFQISIGGGEGEYTAIEEFEILNWEESCGYKSHFYDTSVSSSVSQGVTTVTADISDLITSNNSSEFIYSFAAEVGDTLVEFTC